MSDVDVTALAQTIEDGIEFVSRRDDAYVALAALLAEVERLQREASPRARDEAFFAIKADLEAEVERLQQERDNAEKRVDDLYEQNWPWEWVIATKEKERRKQAERERDEARDRVCELKNALRRISFMPYSAMGNAETELRAAKKIAHAAVAASGEMTPGGGFHVGGPHGPVVYPCTRDYHTGECCGEPGSLPPWLDR